MGERWGGGKQRSMNRGLMDRDNEVGIDCGSGGGWDCELVMGGKL